MLFDVIDEQKTPHFSLSDRLCLVLFNLGMATLEQLTAVTGWKATRVEGAIRSLRDNGGKDKEARARWVRSWRPQQNKPAVYALGEEGVAHARALRGEFYDDDRRTRPVAGHVYHWLGTNGVLCRLIEAGLKPTEWWSGKECGQWLYHSLLERKSPGEKPEARQSPIRPDAMAWYGTVAFLLEYDTGSETTPRIMEKFRRYMDLAAMLEETLPPILFVTVSEGRRQAVARAFQKAQETYGPSLSQIAAKWTHLQILLEGEEVEFIRDWLRKHGKP